MFEFGLLSNSALGKRWSRKKDFALPVQCWKMRHVGSFFLKLRYQYTPIFATKTCFTETAFTQSDSRFLQTQSSKVPTIYFCSFSWWFFTDSTVVNHHFSICLSFFPTSVSKRMEVSKFRAGTFFRATTTWKRNRSIESIVWNVKNIIPSMNHLWHRLSAHELLRISDGLWDSDSQMMVCLVQCWFPLSSLNALKRTASLQLKMDSGWSQLTGKRLPFDGMTVSYQKVLVAPEGGCLAGFPFFGCKFREKKSRGRSDLLLDLMFGKRLLEKKLKNHQIFEHSIHSPRFWRSCTLNITIITITIITIVTLNILQSSSLLNLVSCDDVSILEGWAV